MMSKDSSSGGFLRKTAPAEKAKPFKPLPNERQFIPDRISGDIPFHLYRSVFLSPERYLEFLKKLEQSSSRHDFLFWVFDIVAAGRSADQTVRTITADDLNDFFANPDFLYINKVIASATIGSNDGAIPCSNFSEYLLKTYPEIFKPHLYEDQQNPSLTTFPNSSPELYEYRTKAFSSLTKEHLYLANHDEYFLINPMEGLTAEDFPLPVPETHYEKFDPKKFNKHSFFAYNNHFHCLLTYVGRIPESTDCILVDKSPYKRLQVEAYIKKIDFDKLESVDYKDIQELSDNGTIVVVANDESVGDNITTEASNASSGYETLQYSYQRAKLLHSVPPSNEHSVNVLFVDYGKIAVVSIYQVYKYAFDTNAPKILTTIAPQKKLSKIPEEDDFFVYDFMEKKYFYVGCPTKNFNPAPDPLDELDTDTESVYFGKDAPSIDWEEENELIERPEFDDDDSESSEADSDDEEEDVVYGVQIIAENLENEKQIESDEEEEGGDDEAEENQSDEEDMELF